MALTQKEAVVTAVQSVLGSDYDTSIPAMEQLSKEQVSEVKNSIFSQIKDGAVSFNKDTDDDNELMRYVNGMVSNHFRKAKELNGGVKYSPKTTGRGSRDPQLSNLTQLLKRFEEGSDEFTKVDTAISTRRDELADERAIIAKERRKTTQAKKIDLSALPPELQDLAASVVS